MVLWKGEIEGDEAGPKARLLDSVEELNVPNFFVLEKEEIRDVIENSDRETIKVPEEIESEIKDAYEDIGMSSEVRNAPGRARNLVGGQRENQRVSVRLSTSEKGTDYRLNVGSSELIDALKDVLESAETEEMPGVIFQKMIEPGATGAAVSNYLGSYTLVEAVKGLGTSLEKGISKPAFYLLEDSEVVERKIPDRQRIVERNRMNGNHEASKKNIQNLVEESDIREFQKKLRGKDISVKFVYKRGNFHVVDVFKSENANPFQKVETDLSGIRASPGRIHGSIGEEIGFSDETLSPERYRKALICRKGGYTSTDSQLARKQNKPVIVGSELELERGKKVEIADREVNISKEETGTVKRTQETGRSVPITGADILELGSELGLRPPFGDATYKVSNRDGDIPRSGYLKSYGEVFSFSEDRAVLDVRELEKEGLKDAVDYLDADLKILVVENPEIELILEAVRNGFDAYSAPETSIEEVRRKVEKAERKFMLESLRE